MSKTNAPLLSFGASGQIGKSMVMGKWRGISYARRYVVPANPRTTAQQFNRVAFATLREIWKRLGPITRAPWDAYATGRPFLGLNAFVGENRRAQGTDADMDTFIGSPGARGGLPPEGIVVAATGTDGDVIVTFTVPAAPSGWTLTAAQAMAFPNQAPNAIFAGGNVEAEDTTSPWVVTFEGLEVGTEYVVVGWLKWTLPNGKFAYSPSLGDTVTPTDI